MRCNWVKCIKRFWARRRCWRLSYMSSTHVLASNAVVVWCFGSRVVIAIRPNYNRSSFGLCICCSFYFTEDRTKQKTKTKRVNIWTWTWAPIIVSNFYCTPHRFRRVAVVVVAVAFCFSFFYYFYVYYAISCDAIVHRQCLGYVEKSARKAASGVHKTTDSKWVATVHFREMMWPRCAPGISNTSFAFAPFSVSTRSIDVRSLCAGWQAGEQAQQQPIVQFFIICLKSCIPT